METIPLQDAIDALRREIVAARTVAAAEDVRFELGPIEMEFQVVARQELGGEAKIGFHIFAVEATMGASGRGSDERTQRVKFVLNPVVVDASGENSKLLIRRDDQRASTPSKVPLGRDG